MQDKLPNFPNWLPPGAIGMYEVALSKYETLKNNKPTESECDMKNFGEAYISERRENWEVRLDQSRKNVEMLLRLCTDQNMKPVWMKIEGVKNGQTSLYFIASVLRGFLGPLGDEKLTPGDANDRRNAIITTANKLAKLLSSSIYDTYLFDRKFDLLNQYIFYSIQFEKLLGLVPPEQYPRLSKQYNELGLQIHNLQTRERLSDLLTEFAQRVPKMEVPTMPRPNGPEARRAYFTRHVTKYFQEYFGQPRRSWVTIVTQVALEDESIVERTTARLARAPDTKKKKTAK